MSISPHLECRDELGASQGLRFAFAWPCRLSLGAVEPQLRNTRLTGNQASKRIRPGETDEATVGLHLASATRPDLYGASPACEVSTRQPGPRRELLGTPAPRALDNSARPGRALPMGRAGAAGEDDQRRTGRQGVC